MKTALSLLFFLAFNFAAINSFAANNEALVDSSKKETIKLSISGMTCGGCSSNIHRALSKKAGIISDDLAYPGNVFTIVYDPEKIDEEGICKTITKLGFGCEEYVAVEEK
ncbi:MAG: heavy-metal-associated domain-containing protein [Bacteroidetes bacterium]|nr:heavy-metal-associated domain-containing protein [Bacteroidota bacterium]